MLIRAYVKIFKVKLSVFYRSIAVLQIGLAGTKRFDLRAEKLYSCLVCFMYEIVMACLTVFTDRMLSQIFLFFTATSR